MSDRAADRKRKSSGQGRDWNSMEEVVRKRPIISAKERGPGPGRYALPPTVGYINHDFTKPSSPAYSFHTRMSSATLDRGTTLGARLPGLAGQKHHPTLFQEEADGSGRKMSCSRLPDQGPTAQRGLHH
ncbi:hypothetical protein XENOCAPTIV_010058 [Xenoophorus captivus]|uniref:Uncharacterized protein n=1 Tax=Xenoophorus captivus TaxID=1517983 RepID=A0ABV0QLN7_9TELE